MTTSATKPRKFSDKITLPETQRTCAAILIGTVILRNKNSEHH